ncbi:MAG: c-type cytochrome [Deltaproteobacteria bacterium]|nr:c-type cytochrome [Deltaproteobacteria bacterium]
MKRSLAIFFLLLLAACGQRSCREAAKEYPEGKGKYLYEMHCASCHGVKGDGKGAVAQYLWPKPRDFTAGIFKFRTTRGPIPSDHDLLQTMIKGVPGSSMPGWEMLAKEEWQAILSHVKSFNPRLAQQKAPRSVDIPEEPKATDASIQAGKVLFEKAGCVACHGPQGKGDGPGAMVLKDVWGDRIAPRDLTRGPLKWGNTANDIYRTLMLGIPGTPMPNYEHTFTREQIWSLVHFIQSIQRKLPEGYDPSNPHRNLISAGRVQGEIPLDHEAEVWKKARPIPVFLKPLWYEPRATEWLSVKALQNGKEIAFYIQWEDDRMDVEGERKDGVAVQLPVDEIREPVQLPYLGMGSPGRKVNIWQWKAGSFTEFNAAGVGNLETQNLGQQNVSGKGIYENGQWHVILKRPFKSLFSHDAPILNLGWLSFALWDADLPTHRGPEAFSEWIRYELQE